MAQTAAQKKAAALALLKKAEAAIATTQTRVTQSDAALDAAEKSKVRAAQGVMASAPAVTTPAPNARAAAVTAARLASSPIAQEAARTTAALKSFTAKGGLLGVPGSNLPGYKPVVNPTFNPTVNPVVNPTVTDTTDTTEVTAPSTNITVLKSLLSSLGYSKTLVDSSTQYFMSLIAEGLDYDNIVSLYTDAKDYTLKNGQKVTSPFYEQYGYLNEGLTQPKSASALFNFVEGTKNLIKSYNISSKFAEPDALKKYIANNVTVEKLDERIMSAKLRTITADPQYVNTLRQLKYINNSEDLTDFFLDPKIGEAQLEINRKTASFATEALRRADKGISFNADALTRNAANLISQGRSEAQIADIANQGYETIAQTLQPAVGLSNIFEGANAANAQTIQTELEAEQFLGLESSRRKKLKELGTNIFNQSTGMSTGRTVSYSNYSSAGQI